jgi:hypothetical protein
MNICTRMAVISSLSAVASITFLVTDAQAFQLTPGSIDIQTTVSNPPSGSIFSAPATVTGSAFGNWNLNTSSEHVTFYVTWIFKHALSVVETVQKFHAHTPGNYNGVFTPTPITATNLAAGQYITSLEGIISTQEFGIYESNKDVNRWSVTQPVPEPLTILSSATALGFGAFLKRKQKASEKKS